MKKEFKIIILVLFIFLAIILFGIAVFYKYPHTDISKPYNSNFETSLNKNLEEKSSYEKAINEVERQVQQEFDRINGKLED